MESPAVLDPDEVVHRVKRFKHQSYAESLKDVHLPSALDLTKFDHDIADNESHFYVSLQQWRQLNLSPSFIQFANKVDPLSISMPLLLHNWRDIAESWMTAVDAADDEALRALLDLLQKLAHDLRTTLSPVYADLLAKLLDFLPRPIATPALTALLATLSGLFRYLLVPSIHLDLLQQTWSSFHAVLPSCSPEVQRTAAEVWASVLRRLKTSAREKAVLLMANNLDGVEIASAWTLVFACKSVSSTLHTTSPSMIGPLIDCYLGCENPDLLYTLLRRALTSLIHHCKGAEQFSGIAEILTTRFLTAVGQLPSNDAEVERLRRILQLISVVCSLRRLSSTFQSQSLQQGTCPLATGAGRLFIAEALKVPRFGISLLGALAELFWGGWKLVALPILFRSTGDLLATEPKQTLRLFANLRHSDKLGEVDIVWRRTVDIWLCERLSHWELSPDGVDELHNLLSLSVYVERTPALLVGMIQRMLDAPDPEASWNASHVNAAWVLRTCMHALAGSKNISWRQQVDLAEWTRTVVQRWSWSQCALTGLVGLVQSSPPTPDVLSFSELYLHLRTCIISHSRSLRLSALKILSSNLVKSSPGEQDVLKRCLQGEEVPLDVQGVRERVLRIGRIGQVIKDDEPLATDLCIRWLISQLKVNLRPLWSPAAEALSSLAKRFGDSVWVCLFDELREITKVAKARGLPEWLNKNIEQDACDDPWEEERTWRDGAAHKMRNVISSWLDRDHEQKAIILDQKPSDRFDPVSFETQLLSTLGQCPSLAEKHNRELVPFFLSLVVNDDTVSSLPRYKLNAWLTLFSKFTNPKALHSTETLFTLYRTLLSHSDRALQTVALSCVFTYKPPNLVRHEETLRHFLDDTLWRDELAHLDLASLDATSRPMFVDVTIRLLFGVMLEKKGRTRGGDRRAAVLSTLAVCSEDELGLLVDLMLKPMGSSSRAWQDGEFVLAEDVLKHIGPRMAVYWPALLGTALSLVASAQARLGGLKPIEVQAMSGVSEVQGEEEEDREDTDAEGDANVDMTRTVRTIRQLGFRRLADFFRTPVSFDYAPYLRASFDAIISPRLALLDQENTQAPSALLDVFYQWASQPEYVRYLVDYDDRVLPKVLDCLVATNVKPAVLTHVFDIVDRLLAFSEDDAIAQRIVKPHLSILLANLTTLVERTKGDQHLSSPLAQRQISVLSKVAHHIADSTQASVLVGLLSPLLRKPGKVVPEKTKVNLLTILNNLFVLVPDLSDPVSPTFRRVYELVSHLFLTFRSNGARVTLTSTFNQLATVHPSLQDLAALLESLNACSTKRVNEPDFDRRLTAFTTLNETRYLTLSCRDWLPVLYNALHFVQDPEELAIRNNAAFTLRQFVGVVASDASSAVEAELIFIRTVLPALKNALRSKTELVRAEALGVIAHAVLKCERIASLQEMRPLLAGGDDEASFFTNIHHIQIHRRTRALRRLGEQCEEKYLRGRTLVEIFVPLVEHYIVSTASLDHLLVAEAINTLGRIAKRLQWSAYYSLVQKYVRSSKDKDGAVRVHVRTLVAILENFHFPMEEAVQEADAIVIADDEVLEGEEEKVTEIQPPACRPLCGPLLGYLENRDENEDSLRIPVAVGIANVALHLPASAKEAQIGKLLTVLSQALRSRSQETRDLVRETMCRIAVALGPVYLPLALRELRAALLRGPQLHILAYVTHALLAYVTSPDRADAAFDDLDGCIDDIAHVASEVVFGESGKDVQHEDFKTKMREVKGSVSKGLDCFALSARYVSPNRISALLLPLRSVMEVTNSARPMQQVDEVLRRIASGLNANARLDPPELLVLCHTLVSQNAKFLQEAERKATSVKGRGRKDDRIIQTKRKIVVDSDYYVHNSYRFVVFGLDLFTTAYRRSRFDLHDASAVGETGTIIAIIRSVGSAESEVAQTAFKSLATILRECPTSNVKEDDLLFLLQLLAPDLEEPNRQASVFALLRAIVARKLVVPELYDLMTTVSSILVTSQSLHTRESARSLLLQFLLDYPQGAGRLHTTLAFFARNLSYEHASGRSSCPRAPSRARHQVRHGSDGEACRYAFCCTCAVLVRRLEGVQQQQQQPLLERTVMGHLHAWAVQKEKRTLRSVAVQVYGLVVDALQRAAAPYLDEMLKDFGAVAESSCALLSRDGGEDADEGEMDVDADGEWHATYQMLQGLAKVLQVFPEATTEPGKVRWRAVVQLLAFPHAWVRSAACRLLGVLFAASTTTTEDAGAEGVLTYAGMRDVADKLGALLKSPNVETTVALQAVKNLFFVGKWFLARLSDGGGAEETKEGESDDDGDGDDEEQEESPDKGRSDALPWLFSKLSYQARSAQIARRNRTTAPVRQLDALAVIGAAFLCGNDVIYGGEAARAIPAPHPHARLSYHGGRHHPGFGNGYVVPCSFTAALTSPGIEELKTTAVELQDLVQAKVGTTAFANAYNRIRQGVVSVQQARRVARVTKVTTDPEAAAKRKLARNVMKKESRKRKNRAFAESRGPCQEAAGSVNAESNTSCGA
ncbi:armadillo-type protein [Butyriboletus roseoflavus]|nr:armadillo-type protein [Butyriboletus roseoflavus]